MTFRSSARNLLRKSLVLLLALSLGAPRVKGAVQAGINPIAIR